MYPKNFQNLIDQFTDLPSVGPKMAERLVLSLFKADKEKAESFSEALRSLHNVHTCAQCFNITESDLCLICANTGRDCDTLCVVEDPLDIIPIERARTYNGLYHVLGGTVSGQKSDHLKIHELENRLSATSIREIIIATNFTTEGDMTALFLQKRLTAIIQEKNILLTRLVRGLATGSDIEYADDLTLKSSLTNRTEMI